MVENEGLGVGLRFTLKSSKPLNQSNTSGLEGLNKPIKPINHLEQIEFFNKRKELLDKYRQKQSFRVSIGKSTWIPYEAFNPSYNLREVLKDEIVIEFDTADQTIVVPAINFTGLNLYNAGYSFEWWDHGGKSPHLHIRDLPISHLTDSERATFKKLFIRKYVPKEYLPYVDFTLTGIHLVAIEWATHWKGCYGVKKLISSFNPKEVRAES